MESELSSISEFISLLDGFTHPTCSLPLSPYSLPDITAKVAVMFEQTFPPPTLCNGQSLSITLTDQGDNPHTTFADFIKWDPLTRTLSVEATNNRQTGIYDLRIKATGYL